MKLVLATILSLAFTPLAADGWFDWVPEKKTIAPYCDTKLTDVAGIAALATSGLAAAGAGITTTATFTSTASWLIAGKSSLIIISGTSVTVVTVSTPLVGTGTAVIAAVGSITYVGLKGLCGISNFFDHKFITNEPIPLVMEDYRNGNRSWFSTGEIIPAGTPVYSLGPVDEKYTAYYPNYNGRGLIKLGRFLDHDYETDAPEDDRGFVVVPANSLNPIYIDKYTHIFSEDTLVERNGRAVMLTAGTPFQLLRVRDDGWAAFELADGFNLWVDNFPNVRTVEIKDLIPQ